jgi:hypothetical protein
MDARDWARPVKGDDARDDAPRLVVRVLGWAALACLLVGVVLGYSKYGEPIWTDARVLLLAAGALMMVQATVLGGRRAHPFVAIAPNRALAPGIFTCGLGLAGVGLEHLDAARPWSSLAVPMIVLLGLLLLREAFRGRGSVFLRDESGRWERFWIRAGLWMFGLCWPLFVLMALEGA